MKARKSALDAIRHGAREKLRGHELPERKVTIMGDSPEALEEGLELAQEVVPQIEKELPEIESMHEGMELEALDDEEESVEDLIEDVIESEEEEDDDDELSPEMAAMLIKKLQAKYGL